MSAAADTTPKARPRRNGKRTGRHRLPWTAAENTTLTIEWGEVCPWNLKRKIRGRSWSAIYSHARWIGLPLTLPQGFVSLSAAARRLGLGDGAAVKRLAARQGVAVRLHPHPPTLRPKSTPMQCVDLDDIIAAMEREVLSTEVIYAAALARGIHSGSLWRWLSEEGVLPARMPAGKRRHTRLPTATIDAVVAKRRPDGYGTRAEVATMLGVSQNTITRWLRRAGVATRGHGCTKSIPIAEAQRVAAERRGVA